MKKMKFISVAAAMFAACAMLSSCWGGSSDDPVSPSGSGDVAKVAAETFSIIASSNKDVTFTIDVPADTKIIDKKNATFSNISTVNTLVKITAKMVDATGYVNPTQVAFINLSSATPSVNVSFDFAEKSSDTKTQDFIKTSPTDVTIESDKSTVKGTSMIIPAGTTVIKGNTTDEFSVTAYKAAPETVTSDAITIGLPLPTDPKVMVLSCTPSGAEFSDEVTLRVFVGTELAGQTLAIENNGDKVTEKVGADGYIEFKVDHFSLWSVLFTPFVTKVTTGSVTALNVTNYPVAEGVNTYSYTKNVGVQSTATGLIGLFISNSFGDEETTIVEEGSFLATEAGTATINVVQNYTTYTFGLGENITLFSLTVWDGTVSTVSIVGGGSGTNADPMRHSGGSGN
jgi:hypothetical protein